MPIERITHSLLLVIEAMLADADSEHWGYALAKATGLTPATVQPILTRLEESELVVPRWEDIDPSAEGRRPRRLYRINGAAAAIELSRTLAQHQRRLRPAMRPAPGQAMR